MALLKSRVWEVVIYFSSTSPSPVRATGDSYSKVVVPVVGYVMEASVPFCLAISLGSRSTPSLAVNPEDALAVLATPMSWKLTPKGSVASSTPMSLGTLKLPITCV